MKYQKINMKLHVIQISCVYNTVKQFLIMETYMKIEKEKWQKIKSEKYPKDDQNKYNLEFCEYTKKI